MYQKGKDYCRRLVGVGVGRYVYIRVSLLNIKSSRKQLSWKFVKLMMTFINWILFCIILLYHFTWLVSPDFTANQFLLFSIPANVLKKSGEIADHFWLGILAFSFDWFKLPFSKLETAVHGWKMIAVTGTQNNLRQVGPASNRMFSFSSTERNKRQI